jgi:hypothetical protein
MDRRDSKSLLRDYGVPMQDPNAYSLNYEKDTTRDPRKGLLKKSNKKKKLTNEWLKDKTGLLKIEEAKAMSAGGTIHIKPENKGKFTATKKKTGKTTEELTHSTNPVTKKRAIFAQNAKKWKHEDGGRLGLHGEIERRGMLPPSSKRKAMEGAKLSIGGMGQMQGKAPIPTKRNAPADKVKQNFGLYKRKTKVPRETYGH